MADVSRPLQPVVSEPVRAEFAAGKFDNLVRVGVKQLRILEFGSVLPAIREMTFLIMCTYYFTNIPVFPHLNSVVEFVNSPALRFCDFYAHDVAFVTAES